MSAYFVSVQPIPSLSITITLKVSFPLVISIGWFQTMSPLVQALIVGPTWNPLEFSLLSIILLRRYDLPVLYLPETATWNQLKMQTSKMCLLMTPTGSLIELRNSIASSCTTNSTLISYRYTLDIRNCTRKQEILTNWVLRYQKEQRYDNTWWSSHRYLQRKTSKLQSAYFQPVRWLLIARSKISLAKESLLKYAQNCALNQII